jgi:DNA-binding phage protein
MSIKRQASISHDEALISELRKDPEFAAEYLKSALEDEVEPQVLSVALRQLLKAWKRCFHASLRS